MMYLRIEIINIVVSVGTIIYIKYEQGDVSFNFLLR